MARSDLNIILRLTDKASRGLKNASKSLTGFEKVAAGAGLALVGAGAAAAAFAVKSVKLAARVETLGVVTKVLGKNIGLTASEVRDFEKAIVAQGITLKAARQSMAQMIQANIDLSKASDIARLAQNAAVIAGVDSSEAFQRVITTIQTANVRMGRTIGLQLNFNDAYKKGAEALGKHSEALTTSEKAQIRANHVLEQGTNIAGAYEAAMETAGKQVKSTRRHIERLMDAIGQGALPAYATGIKKTNQFISDLADLAEEANEVAEAIVVLGVTLDDYSGYVDHFGNTVAESDAELIALAKDLLDVGDVWDETAQRMRMTAEDPIVIPPPTTEPAKQALETFDEWLARWSREAQRHLKLTMHMVAMEAIADPQVELGPGEEQGLAQQHGGTFTVPPGFPNDSFPVRASSGERVSVDNSERSFFSNSSVNINNGQDIDAFEEMLRQIQ